MNEKDILSEIVANKRQEVETFKQVLPLRKLYAMVEQKLSMGGSDLRKRINRLRRKGVPIASSREGYFYAATAGEVYATIRLLREMTAGLESAIRGLEAALESFGEGGESHR